MRQKETSVMELSRFASKNLTSGQLNSLVRKLGGEAVVRKILSGYAEVDVVPMSLFDVNMLSVFTVARKFVPKEEFGSDEIYGRKCKFHNFFLRSVVGAAKGKEVDFIDNGSTFDKGAYQNGCAQLLRPIEPCWLLTALSEEIIFTDVDELLGRLVQFMHPESDSLDKRSCVDNLFYVLIGDKVWLVTVWLFEDVWQFGASLVDSSGREDDMHKKAAGYLFPAQIRPGYLGRGRCETKSPRKFRGLFLNHSRL